MSSRVGSVAASDRTPAVCFDATGTLIEMTRSVGETYHSVALDHGVDLPAWRLDDAFRRILRGMPPRTEWAQTLDYAGRCAHEVDWWFECIRQTFQATDSTVRFTDFPAFGRALFEMYRGASVWRIRPGIQAVLLELQRAGCPMAVVSNFDHRLPDILQDIGLINFFQVVQIPALGGRAKPAQEAFESLQPALDRPIESFRYVGDDDASILEQIERLGIRTLDVNGIQSPEDILTFSLEPAPENGTATVS